MNLIYKTQTHRHKKNKLMAAKGERWGGKRDKLGVWD